MSGGTMPAAFPGSISSGAFDALIDRLATQLGPVVVPMPAGGNVIRAAVALLLRSGTQGAGGGVDGGAEILFIKRSEREDDPWSGHIAFPGGRFGAADSSLVDVAVREITEEVGIDLRHGGRILGSLPSVKPLSAHVPPVEVTPFLALPPAGAVVHPDPAEVDDAFWIPLAALRQAGPTEVVRRRVGGETREWQAYRSPRGPIWGITERILTAFLALVPAPRR